MGLREGRVWLLISTPDPHRRGYSLLELLIALSILSLALAVGLPNGMRALDRMVLHSVLFEFQNSLGQARNRAFLAEADVELAPDGGLLVEALQPRPGWSASADRPMFIRSDGSCPEGTVTFHRGEEPSMQVRVDSECRARRVS